MEERAFIYATEKSKCWVDSYVRDSQYAMHYDEYMQIAKEQETIDNEHISKITKVWLDKCNELVSLTDKREKVLIDKACEWIKSHCDIVGGSITNWEKDFRKTMKE